MASQSDASAAVLAYLAESVESVVEESAESAESVVEEAVDKEDEVQVVEAPPPARVPVVHVDLEDMAKTLVDTNKAIKAEQANQTLSAKRKAQKDLKRSMVDAMGIGDEVVNEDGSKYVKVRKPNRDANTEKQVQWMEQLVLNDEEKQGIVETGRLPDTVMFGVIEAGTTFRDLLIKVPAKKSRASTVPIKVEPL